MPRILVADDYRSQAGADMQRSQAVLACGQHLAGMWGQQVDVLHVQDLETFFPPGKAYIKMARQLLQSNKQNIGELESALPPGSRVLLLRGAIVPTLLKTAHKKGMYSALVLGTRGKRGLEKMILGSASEEVLRNSKIPTVVLGPQSQTKDAATRTGPIVLGSDLGRNSKSAEKYALMLAKKAKSRVLLVHALADGYPPAIQAGLTGTAPLREMQIIFDELRTNALSGLKKKALAFQKAGVSCDIRLDEKALSAGEALLKVSQEAKASAIVVGTHGRTRLGTAFFGSTVRDLIIASPVPVHVLRSLV